METRIRISVVVPTHNRRALLADLIGSLFAQTLDPSSYEVIVIDDGSTDDTPELLREFAGRYPARLVQRRVSPNRGPVHARNLGALLARGDVIAFTDSDCRVSPTWLARGLQTFDADPTLAFVSGPVLDKPEQPVRFFSLPNGTKPGENPVYPTWNIFYRRQILLDMGGFDETAWFGNVGDRPIDCSDSDFALNLKELTYPYRFVEDLVVYHHVWSVTPWKWLKAFCRVVYVPAIIKRHPSLRKHVLWRSPFISRENASFYLALAGGALMFGGAWWGAVLTVPHLWWTARVAGTRFAVRHLPRIAGAIVFLSLRQMVICGALLYGSVRFRTLVL